METTASTVRVWWETGDARGAHPLPGPDRLRLVASGPATPRTVAVIGSAPVDGLPPCGAGFADEHLVADAGERGPWPPVADVLVVPPGRPAALRAEFPGCLVAVFVRASGEHLLEVATGWFARLVPLRDGGAEAWPYASFVHAWTVAGRPLDALHGACLVAGPPGRARGVRVSLLDHSAGWPAAS